ncbi:hypothetical protein T12_10145 [Trichinella patagoniensis]|uniref:Uncharacterized protein n=1 Tax=Trichinella patagoniensis TaxID=990121 RepID=A0A0V0ZGD2_9BILA|nr:hypothetical protein T12_10145 [Trichinella patagoniensis]
MGLYCNAPVIPLFKFFECRSQLIERPISAVLPPPTVNAACTVWIQDQATAHDQSVFYAISP